MPPKVNEKERTRNALVSCTTPGAGPCAEPKLRLDAQAQRAHRARRSLYIKQLEEKVARYEASTPRDELVQQLEKENAALRKEVAQIRAQMDKQARDSFQAPLSPVSVSSASSDAHPGLLPPFESSRPTPSFEKLSASLFLSQR